MRATTRLRPREALRNQVNTSVTDEQLRLLDGHAAARQMSVSAVIREAIRFYMAYLATAEEPMAMAQ